MTVFKAYFKIIRRNIATLSIFLFVFLGVSMIITTQLHNASNAAFNDTHVNITVLNDDGSEPLAAGLVDYLGRHETLVAVENTPEAVQDALFYGNIAYALRIPAGFSQSFLSGGDMQLQKVAASGLDSSVSVDFTVQRYLELTQLHLQGQPGATVQDVVAAVEEDLKKSADVRVNLYGSSTQTSALSYYFQYLAYCLLAMMILGVTSTMIALNDRDLNNRNQCSPVPPLKMNLQLALGNGILALVLWILCCALAFAVYGSVPRNLGTVLLCANALAVTLVALSIAFLCGKFIHDPGVQNAVSNVISLGLSFLSGVFVEQELLGPGVLRFARFEPVYWYVKAVGDIRNLSDYSLHSLQGILGAIGIQLGFAVAIFLVALALTKQLRIRREI